MRSHLTPAQRGEGTCPPPHHRAESTGMDLITSSVIAEDCCIAETCIKREVSCLVSNLLSYFSNLKNVI